MADSSLGSKETAAPSQGGVAVLEQALWRDLTGTADEAVFASAWVGLVHRMIPGSIGGVLVLFGATPDAAPLVVNSAHGLPTDAGQLAAARAAIEARRGVVQPAPSTVANPPTRIS